MVDMRYILHVDALLSNGITSNQSRVRWCSNRALDDTGINHVSPTFLIKSLMKHLAIFYVSPKFHIRLLCKIWFQHLNVIWLYFNDWRNGRCMMGARAPGKNLWTRKNIGNCCCGNIEWLTKYFNLFHCISSLSCCLYCDVFFFNWILSILFDSWMS